MQVQRTRDVRRPFRLVRPVARQPRHCGLKSPHLNVRSGDESVELLAVAEKPPTHGGESDALGTSIGSRDVQKIINRAHEAQGCGISTGAVNGNLTGSSESTGRSSYRPMLKDVLHRVEKRLETLNLTANAASRRAGLSEDAIRNLRRAAQNDSGRQGVTTRTIGALAGALETNADWLLTGRGDENSTAATRTVAVVGLVGAGSVATLFSEGQGPFDEVEAPANANDDTVALGIQGASLGPAFDQGLVFYDDVRSPVTPDLHGRLCVVGLIDGRVLVKLLRSAGDGTYHLISNTIEEPILNAEVTWAARVTDVRPR